MKNYFKILCSLLLITSLSQVYAQEENKKHSLQDGSKALQFRITDNFTLTSFSGSAFSYKRHISDNRAHRISLSLQNSLRNTEAPDDPSERETSGFNGNISASFSWTNYINPENEIKFYYGYGPGVSFGYQTSQLDDINRTTTKTDLEWGVSGLGYTGFEWFFHPSISLHAEYRGIIRANFRTLKTTNKIKQSGINEETNEMNETEFSFGSNGVRFGLSVYF